MNPSKLFTTIAFVLVGITLVVLLWREQVVLSILLTLAGFIKSKVIPIKKEFVWFIASAICASLTESSIMYLTGAWKYDQQTIINFPIWLVFLWGYGGTLAVSFYEGITRKK